MWCTALVLLDVVGSDCGALRYRMRAVLVVRRTSYDEHKDTELVELC